MAIMCDHERSSCAIVFYSLDRRSEYFSRVRESGLRDKYTDVRVAHGDAMVAHERRCEYILRVKKKTT
jgi:hypothetical protein